MILMIAAAIAFAVFEPIQVLPRLRLAPGYALVDANGGSFTSETVRGSVTLYSFASIDCDTDCEDSIDAVRTVQDRVASEIDLGSTEFRMVTIVVDPDREAGELATVQDVVGADGASWAIVNGSAADLERTISIGFDRYYEIGEDGQASVAPGFLLVDGSGVLRGDYRYSTLADDADKLVRHVELLASEIRNADGASAVAYEAAHLFLCYP